MWSDVDANIFVCDLQRVDMKQIKQIFRIMNSFGVFFDVRLNKRLG